MVLGVKAARFCVFTAKNSQLRESTHDGLQSTFRQEKKLIEEEKNVFKEFRETKKAFFTKKNALLLFLYLILYTV